MKIQVINTLAKGTPVDYNGQTLCFRGAGRVQKGGRFYHEVSLSEKPKGRITKTITGLKFLSAIGTTQFISPKAPKVAVKHIPRPPQLAA